MTASGRVAASSSATGSCLPANRRRSSASGSANRVPGGRVSTACHTRTRTRTRARTRTLLACIDGLVMESLLTGGTISRDTFVGLLAAALR
ncbi:hypothetical protein FHX73_19174 [Kitasatospora viridis]|uniref:Uncharacterized protein n=1 Tax=Kitasatospora viridis TaxID=281105 RepID=A0A561S9L1_9ACTN|nr:hypothetical protein FHX73_19174 [Kitasatospora viridis]